MSSDAQNLPDDPAALKAMIAALQAENAKISATLRAHDQLIQTLRLRIAKLRKQAFGQSSEKIEREIEQLELALEDLMIAAAETDATPINDADGAVPAQPTVASAEGGMRRRPLVSANGVRERRELDPGTCCPRGMRVLFQGGLVAPKAFAVVGHEVWVIAGLSASGPAPSLGTWQHHARRARHIRDATGTGP